MHKEILIKKQVDLLPLLNLFKNEFGLVGGTAIALYIGHRESIDFYLFILKEFDNLKIRNKITKMHKINSIIRDESNDFTVVVNNVNFTFFYYPFKIIFSENLDNIIKMPSLLTLGAMKAYALGRRPKWKDYVDMYYILSNYFSINDIINKAKEIFGVEFNEKLFRTQLAYFEDIDYSEKVIFKKGFAVDDKKIQKELIKFSLN